MKAIVVRATGSPDVLEHTDVETPEPGAGDLLVQVEAAGVNFIDTYHRSGLYSLPLPFTPGLEGAGTVVSIGDDVRSFTEGDRVGWTQTIGSYAEMQTVPAAQAVKVPPAIASKTVAAVMLQGITAHYLTKSTYQLRPTDVCLVHAGAGGVGLLATQMAKMAGATVIATVGTREKAALSREAGADHVIVYTETDFKEAVEDIMGTNAVDVVYDGVGAATFYKSIDLLRPRGTMVTFGNASGPVPEISPLLLAQKGSVFLTRPTMGDYLQTREELLLRTSDLFDWIEESDLAVRIGAEYPLSEARSAHRALEGRATTGKVVLIP